MTSFYTLKFYDLTLLVHKLIGILIQIVRKAYESFLGHLKMCTAIVLDKSNLVSTYTKL